MSGTETNIAIPKPDDIVRQYGPLEKTVLALKITDVATHGEALELGKRVRSLQRFVIEMHEDPKKRFHEGHKAVCAQEKKYLDPLQRLLGVLNGGIDTFEREQKRKAEEEARVREAEARRIEEERQLAEAAAAEDAGDHELAESIIEQPVETPTVLPQPEVATVAGVSSRTTWAAKVVDFKALVKFCAERPDQINLLLPNDAALNGMARALKADMRIPGVRPVSSSSRSYRDI